jgi:gamma-aminobutyric acid receptor subunit beta
MNKIFCFLVLQSFCLSLLAFTDISLPPGERPVKLDTIFYVADLNSINTSGQSFDARFFYIVSWHDKRLAHKEEKPVIMKLTEVWHPNIQIINQRKVYKTLHDLVKVMPDGKVIYTQAGWGTFSQSLKLKNFPFDKQKISFNLVAASGYPPTKVQFVTNKENLSGISDELSIADWKISDWKEEVKPFMLKNFTKRPGMILSFTATRLTAYYVAKMILPLVMIVMMSWAVFWMDPLNVAGNVGVSITSMLTLIAYRFSADTILPRLSYLTSLDYFILASTILVFLSLGQNLTTSALAKRDKMKQSRRLDVVCRFAFPSVFIIITVETMWLRWFL